MGWWLSLHRSDHFWPQIAVLAVRSLEREPFREGVGSEILAIEETDDGGALAVEVKFVLEQFPKGWIFHILSIRSEGDPWPPFAANEPPTE